MGEVIGVYAVPEADEPCYLVEMVVPVGDFDMGDITQADANAPESDWQVPWDEQVLEEADERTRVAFFFHYLDVNVPLKTPWGDLVLPAPSQRPDRLASIRYEQP